MTILATASFTAPSRLEASAFGHDTERGAPRPTRQSPSNIEIRKRRIVDTLIAQGVQVRKASLSGNDGEALRGLVDAVFVQERRYLERVFEDPWDKVSQYYMVTVQGEPAGCARVVDPEGFPQLAAGFPRMGLRARLPMEKSFPLDDCLGEKPGFVEVGRFVLLPKYRGIGGLSALMATGYLHVLRNKRAGAVCMAVSELAPVYQQMGWHFISERFLCKAYNTSAQAMVVTPDCVTEHHQHLSLEMEAAGVITI